MKLLGLRIFGDYEPERGAKGARAARNPLSILADVPLRSQPLPRAFHKQPVSYDRRIWMLAFLTGFPGALVSLIMLWTGDHTPKVQWTLTVFILSFWLGCAFALRERVVMPLQTLSNLLAALREGDYSIRGRMVNDDALGDVVREVNTLSSILRAQRLGAMEATALLRTVTNEIDVAIFAFDSNQRLRLVNRAGERLLDRPSEQLLGRSADDLGLRDCLEGAAARTLQRSFPGGT